MYRLFQFPAVQLIATYFYCIHEYCTFIQISISCHYAIFVFRQMFFYYFSITKLSTLFWIIFANNFFCSYNSRLLVFGVRPKLNKNVKKGNQTLRIERIEARKLKLKLQTEVGYQNTKAAEITAAITTLLAATRAMHMTQQQVHNKIGYQQSARQPVSQSVDECTAYIQTNEQKNVKIKLN